MEDPILGLNRRFACPGRVAFREGPGGAPLAVLVGPRGACEVSLHGGQVLSYRLVGTSGPDHAKVFRVEVDLNGAPVGAGEGHSKKEAEQNAAKAAIARLTKSE